MMDHSILEIDKKSYIQDLKGLGNNEKVIIHAIDGKFLPFLNYYQ